jgi:AAA+ superfamily predicted ATPase
MNLKIIEADIEWLQRVIRKRLNTKGREDNILNEELPVLPSDDSSYGKFIIENDLQPEERLILILSMIPHIAGHLMHELITEKNRSRLIQTEMNSLLPSGETALFLLAGDNITKRMGYQSVFETDHLFYRKSVIDLGGTEEGASVFEGALKINKSYLDLFTLNKFKKPRFSTEFPAHLLTTSLEWEDMILNSSTKKKLEEIKAFHTYEEDLKEKWKLKKHFKPGYRCLFYGPSGTGKTLAVSLLGKQLNKDVYRVDLSTVVSKYIGETAKNLNNLFNTAEDKDWILFFDEGDALFGKRADTSNVDNKAAHYANQDIGFLLQRIENYSGLVIVASNLRKNMDDAFSRRFQIIVHFDIPDKDNRLRLWKENLPDSCSLEPAVDLGKIAAEHHISAASIINVINRVSLVTMQKDKNTISKADLDLCILDEQHK